MSVLRPRSSELQSLASRKRRVSTFGKGSVIIKGFGTAGTATSLIGVRRIRISSGAPGHSRSPSNVSGLWFDYYDDDRPVIVGQWIKEMDSLHLLEEETIEQIEIWTSSEESNLMYDAKLGKVVALRITTSAGNSKEVMGDTSDAVVLKYRANPFENLVRIQILIATLLTIV